jgi:epoxyqueuosine reductase
LRDLRDALDASYRQGLLNEEFYQERLTGFARRRPVEMPDARSLIIVAFRDPPMRFSFVRRRTRRTLVVPPTYLHWQEKDKEVQGVLDEILRSEGYRVAQVAVPKKLLAVCSGLAVYGRNNVTYVEGMGSLHRLAAFCSDRPSERDLWREPMAMERCARCTSCVSSCPTGAIDSERFLLRAERCLTFLNEKPPDVAFPAWVEPSWHNCLVGCMHCQNACPENRGLLDWCEDGAEFSEEETGFLLEGRSLAELPAALSTKLQRWDLDEWLDILPRNLSALLGSAG